MRNLMSNPIVQLLSVVLLVVSAFSLLSRSSVGRFILLLIVITALLAALLTWVIKNRPRWASKLSRYPGFKQVIETMCHALGLQPPAPLEGKRPASAAADEPPPIEFPVRLDDPAFDFQDESAQLKEATRGHDRVIDSALASLAWLTKARHAKETQTRRPPPRGVFLFAGAEGVGKAHFAKQLSRMVFAEDAIFRRDLSEYRDVASASAVLFGGKDGPASMVSAVLKKPCHTVLLENIDAAPAEVLVRLHKALAAGAVVDSSSGSKVTFENCLFVFTTSKGLDGLRAARGKFDRPGPWLNAARNELAQSTSLPAPLLTLLNDVCYFEPPSGPTKAEVLVLLMERECRSVGATLEYVDPDFLVEQVEQMEDDHGFSLLTANRVREIMGNDLLQGRSVEVGGKRPRAAAAASGRPAPAPLRTTTKETIRP